MSCNKHVEGFYFRRVKLLLPNGKLDSFFYFMLCKVKSKVLASIEKKEKYALLE